MPSARIAATVMLCSLLLPAAAFSQHATAAGGEAAAPVADLPAFDKIKADGQVILDVTVGAAVQAVTVETHGGARKDLELEVKRGTLRVREHSRVDGMRGRSLYRVRIELPKLTAVNVGAGSRTDVAGVNSDHFAIHTTTGAQLHVTGRCGELALSVNTGGVVDASELHCERAKARANTGGAARIHATAAVDAGANTGGEIDVYGAPAVVDQGAWLGGDVSVRNERS